MSAGRVEHVYLGIAYVPLNPAIAAQIGVRVQQGAVVTDVTPGSPAAGAGLRPDDVITRIDSADLVGESALAAALDKHKPGDRVTLTINRGGSTRGISVTLGAAPS